MKTLETIQKTCKVFYTLVRVVMCLSFVWAGFNLVGAICSIIWYNIGDIPGSVVESMLFEENGGVFKSIGVFLGDFVVGVTDGILFFFAARYLKKELADGTPFTVDGAKQVMSLGIKTIVMPLAAVVICAVLYSCFDISLYDKWSNASSVVLGVALILVSLILQHGAELREDKNNEENI